MPEWKYLSGESGESDKSSWAQLELNLCSHEAS